MGSSISVDKHVSNLDDLLQISPKLFAKIKFENKISDKVTEHLKIWRFFDDRKKYDIIKTAAVPLNRLPQTGFCFSSEQAYLVLFIYKSDNAEKSEIVNFPHSMWGVVESASNLTPRGLQNVFSSSIDDYIVHSLDSFLLSNKPSSDNLEFKYMLFVWNGKNTNALVKALALTKGYELDNLLQSSKDCVLKVLYSGGVIRKKKLQKGHVINFNEIISNDVSKDVKSVLPATSNNKSPISTPELLESKQNLIKTYESVYLFKWLFPESSIVGKQEAIKMRKHKIKPKCPLLLKQFYKPIDGDKEEQSRSKEQQKQMRKEYEALFDDIDQLMFSDQDQFNSSPQKNFDQQLQQEQLEQSNPRQMKEEKKQFLNLSKIDTLAGKNLSQQESSGRGSNSAAKIQFKLLQSDEPMSSARATDDKPKIGGLNLANALKINSANLNRFEDEQNSSPNNSPKWPQEQSPAPPLANRRAQKSGIGKLNLESKIGSPDNEVLPQKFSSIQKEQNQTPLFLSNLGQNIPKTQMQQVKMIQQRGLDPANFGRDTTRMQQQHLKYKNQISQIIDDLLYLGGQYVASNKQQLLDTGITHIINCASDYCPSPFVDQFKYKNYHLKDTKQQSIECVFYDAIEFIQQAKASGGKVFVHCVQGISRSSTICMSYLIFTTKIDLNQALAYVQSRRQIANPNLNFIIQLIWFHRRLYQEYKELSNSVNPRIFLISSHQKEDPHFIVARLLIEQLFKQKNGKKFDPKGVFLLQSQQQFAVWVGKDCKGLTKQKYLQKALSYVKIIHKNQRPAKKIKLSSDLKQVKIYQQGQQNNDFLRLWKDSSTKPVLGEPFSQKVHQWEEIFRDLEKCDQQDQQHGGFSSPLSSPQKVSTNPTTSSGGNSLVQQGEVDQEQDEILEKDQKPKQFYQYPNPTDNIGDLQVQQLIPNKLYVLCVIDTYTTQKTAYIWKGEQFQGNKQLSEESFVDKCIQNYFGGKSDVIINTENIDDQSDRFMNYLY